MSRDLKHLNALRALEASARLGSFTLAAKELEVTPAAVGQQVRILEEYLGRKIFHRTPRGLQVTTAASVAMTDLQSGFDRLEAGLKQLGGSTSDKQISVSVAPALAARWLAPRIQRLYERCPQIDLRLDTSLKLADIAGGEFDLAIRYIGKDIEDLETTLLFDEFQIPVCVPEIAPQASYPISEIQILTMPLLHIEYESDDSKILSWEKWGARHGLKPDLLKSGPRYPDSTMALQATLNGQGVAFCGLSLVIDDLVSGKLIAPMGPGSATKAGYAYQIVHSPVRRQTSIHKTFTRWIKLEASKTNELITNFLQGN